MTENRNRELFFIEEYKALTLHYFHEDTFYLQTVGLFTTINVGLLTLYGSQVVVAARTEIHIAFIAAGLVATLAFGMSLARVRYVRRRIEVRIREMEHRAQGFVGTDEVNFTIFQALDRENPGKWYEGFPVSKIMLLFPMIFLIIWTSMLATLLIAMLSRG